MAKATKKVWYYCNGGPYDGKKILLTTPNTFVFTAGGMLGRYIPGSVRYPSNRACLSGGEPKLVPVTYENFVGVDLIWETYDDL